MYYYLENRYQDSNWERFEDINSPFSNSDRALKRAKKLSDQTVLYGMVRVVDAKGTVLGTFSGGRQCH